MLKRAKLSLFARMLTNNMYLLMYLSIFLATVKDALNNYFRNIHTINFYNPVTYLICNGLQIFLMFHNSEK